ncbi:molybdopterin-guanine dinucleotide biosynthesis protein B [Oricola indica]|jgi:molybdopterin-guanine dinucleotide biosynthesis protein B|uniref:molybdopterin-guanine dinucleotide biosynthesis protein B n=1 Tax=Oricola indica TaxID=2872591 RepID=UPI001CBADDC6|nr:molybdopterin-guanine dinucleotide biosynthesis protein B [Oricola indica]
MKAGHRVIGIIGWKNSGKTRMVAALVAELNWRGWAVSTIKHAHHDFDIDHEGTDSWTHRKSGAREVAIVSGRRWALMHENSADDDEPPLADMLNRLSPCDIVLIEGYKREAHAKIEIRRTSAADNAPLSSGDETIVAVVSDDPDATAGDLPVFGHDAVSDVADFIERQTGLDRR